MYGPVGEIEHPSEDAIRCNSLHHPLYHVCVIYAFYYYLPPLTNQPLGKLIPNSLVLVQCYTQKFLARSLGRQEEGGGLRLARATVYLVKPAWKTHAEYPLP